MMGGGTNHGPEGPAYRGGVLKGAVNLTSGLTVCLVIRV